MGETLQVYFGPCVYIYVLPNYPHNSFFFLGGVGWKEWWWGSTGNKLCKICAHLWFTWDANLWNVCIDMALVDDTLTKKKRKERKQKQQQKRIKIWCQFWIFKPQLTITNQSNDLFKKKTCRIFYRLKPRQCCTELCDMKPGMDNDTYVWLLWLWSTVSTQFKACPHSHAHAHAQDCSRSSRGCVLCC